MRYKTPEMANGTPIIRAISRFFIVSNIYNTDDKPPATSIAAPANSRYKEMKYPTIPRIKSGSIGMTISARPSRIPGITSAKRKIIKPDVVANPTICAIHFIDSREPNVLVFIIHEF